MHCLDVNLSSRGRKRNWGFQVPEKTSVAGISVASSRFLFSDLRDLGARTMSGPVQEKAAAGGGGGASRPGPPQAEAPFVPEAASPAERAAGWKNPPSRMQLILWSGSKRHVFVGMLGVSVLATIPWLMLTSGKKHDSHADYMDRAEGARRARLSNASAAVAPPTSS